jgi:hypothetical protein
LISLTATILVSWKVMHARSEIVVAFSAEDRIPLGDMWRLTGKERDFYLNAESALRPKEIFHISFHGPKGRHRTQRFHIKHNQQAAGVLASQGKFVAAGAFPPAGLPFSGEQLSEQSWRVARIRWLGELQRERYRAAARTNTPIPELSDSRRGAVLSGLLPPNYAADLDIFIAFDKPFWPDDESAAYRDGPPPSLADNARLGPVKAASAGMWLTAVSYRRWLSASPSAVRVPRLPRPGETPTWIMSGSLEETTEREIYWFVQSMTSNEVLAAWPDDGMGDGSLFR